MALRWLRATAFAAALAFAGVYVVTSALAFALASLVALAVDRVGR